MAVFTVWLVDFLTAIFQRLNFKSVVHDVIDVLVEAV